MLTQKEIEDRIRDRHMSQMKPAEDQIDAALEDHWEERHKGIHVTFSPPVHRSILNALAEKYRGPGKYTVEFRSTRNDYNYDTLVFKPHSVPHCSEL